jgi:hypothetical protein
MIKYCSSPDASQELALSIRRLARCRPDKKGVLHENNRAGFFPLNRLGSPRMRLDAQSR